MGEWMYKSNAFLTSALDARLAVSFTPLPLYHSGNSQRYPLNKRLAGTQSRSGRYDENILLLLSGIKPQESSPSLYQLYARRNDRWSGLSLQVATKLCTWHRYYVPLGNCARRGLHCCSVNDSVIRFRFKKKKFIGDSFTGETIYSPWLALEEVEPEGHTHWNGYSNNVALFVSGISL
jgi:hypothetical protein